MCIPFLLLQGAVDPIDYFLAEAVVMNDKFKSDTAIFYKFVGEKFPNKTISHNTWADLETPVKEELIRLGYKEED